MSGSANPPPGGDPSMEDILASIRRILSEDEPAAAGGAGDSPGPAEAPEKRVLVLHPSMLVEDPQPSSPVEHRMTQDVPAERPSNPDPTSGPKKDLVAPEAAAAAASSVGNLVRTLSGRSTQISQGGPTLEDVVRDEIRPILKQWLDANLPPIVERLVRVEIERVVGHAAP